MHDFHDSQPVVSTPCTNEQQHGNEATEEESLSLPGSETARVNDIPRAHLTSFDPCFTRKGPYNAEVGGRK